MIISIVVDDFYQLEAGGSSTLIESASSAIGKLSALHIRAKKVIKYDIISYID
jgi:hypothetical protein